MSEKRKPAITLVAAVGGKTFKVELFDPMLWPRKFSDHHRGQYRARINGKWRQPGTFTLSQVMREIRRIVVHHRNKELAK